MLSAIVPVHNAAHVLPRTVPAMLAQTEPAEWWFVDDGSTDETPATLDALLAPGPSAAGARVRVLRLPRNRGRAAARNAGIAAATGSLLAFMDADLAPVPDALARLTAAVARPGVVAAVGRLDYEAADRREPYQHYLASRRRGVRHPMAGGALPWRYFLLGLAAMRAEALQAVGGLDESISYGEDLDLAVRLAARYPEGLRYAPAARGRLYDLGDLDGALRKMREFGGQNLPRIMARGPEAAELAGLARLTAEAGWRGRLLELALRAPGASVARRLLPFLPGPLSDVAVRYLLGHALVSSYRAAVSP